MNEDNLPHIFSVMVNQAMVATVKLSKWWLQLKHKVTYYQGKQHTHYNVMYIRVYEFHTGTLSHEPVHMIVGNNIISCPLGYHLRLW